MGRQSTWNDERDAILKRMLLEEGCSRRRISRVLGVSIRTVLVRIDQLDLASPAPAKAAPAIGEHIASYRRARRGFELPRHLEDQYHALLRGGLSIADARQRLGLKT